ncbi:serine carboxypeptidase-like 25 [Andrographis paniculata]|uniref:serine carboxypeptidase-like 25 n=1 Tax=Andrographis paniculata TaxID=175694 RepID=UPI0021E8E732|nr:serine carboxypeptidase-like 25 [Andrographis paniculata]
MRICGGFLSNAVVFGLTLTLCLHLLKSQAGDGDGHGDRIVALPGQPKVVFQQFSGYVTVDEAAGRSLFYWLTEAADRPSEKPLVVWLNGGPGCSSIAYGASEEIGPFKINKTASGLYLNKYSWNKLANLLFLEAPAGVGFSYTNRSSDLLNTGDRRTAKDSARFLVRWLDRFPKYKNREIYLTGESYAGHYVPQLAREVLEHNRRSRSKINLKGVMVGNAVTDNYYDNVGTVNYWWSHAMISDRTYRRLLSTCDFKGQVQDSSQCENLYYYAMDKEFGNIDQYNIYAPPCRHNSDRHRHLRRRIRLPHLPYHPLSGYDPCTEKYAEIYYNRGDVQRALHANISGHIPYKWTACSETLNRNWNDTETSVLPIYRQLIAAGLRIWVFSGDVDSVVPVTATRYSLAQLKLETNIPWYPWYVNNQVGGWTEVYKGGLTFATVRGAGHEVPMFKPRAAFQLFTSFLKGRPLPRSSSSS